MSPFLTLFLLFLLLCFLYAFYELPCAAHYNFLRQEKENNANDPRCVALHQELDKVSIYLYKAIMLMMCLEFYGSFWLWLHIGKMSSGDSL